MSRRKTPARPERLEADHWVKAHGSVKCAFGCWIAPGEWMRFGRRGSVICQVHAKQYYNLEPPSPLFSFKPAALEDVRVRQVGED